jgi:hypothetical protein
VMRMPVKADLQSTSVKGASRYLRGMRGFSKIYETFMETDNDCSNTLGTSGFDMS